MAPAAELPPGFEQKEHQGRVYYVDHNTKSTTWEHPTVRPPPPPYDELEAKEETEKEDEEKDADEEEDGGKPPPTAAHELSPPRSAP